MEQATKPKPSERKGDKRNNIPEHVHQEARRVARNLMRMEPKPRSRK